MRMIVYLIPIMTICNSVFSQVKKKHNYEIKTNLLNIIASGPSLALEYGLRENSTVMLSFASGKIDYADFGGLSKYKTTTLEFRKYSPGHIFFIGPYLKNIQKQVYWRESYIGGTIPFTIGKNRDFLGNGLSIGASFGAKFNIFYKFKIELSSQLGLGHYYKMSDKFNNIPSGNYLDTRIALWLGYRI